MSSFDIPSVCPLTNEALPESSLDLAVSFSVAVPSSITKTCGHVCTMGALVNHIEDNKGPIKFPTCEKSHVISVCDLDAAQKLCSDDDPSRADLIAFRYGPQVYYLTVSEGTTAQDRISQVLGVEDVHVLHHGKTVHPDSNKTDDEVSSALLQICQSEKGKPTLVISGKRTGRWGAQGGHVHR
jgi:hypothetical protein